MWAKDNLLLEQNTKINWLRKRPEPNTIGTFVELTSSGSEPDLHSPFQFFLFTCIFNKKVSIEHIALHFFLGLEKETLDWPGLIIFRYLNVFSLSLNCMWKQALHNGSLQYPVLTWNYHSAVHFGISNIGCRKQGPGKLFQNEVKRDVTTLFRADLQLCKSTLIWDWRHFLNCLKTCLRSIREKYELLKTKQRGKKIGHVKKN